MTRTLYDYLRSGDYVIGVSNVSTDGQIERPKPAYIPFGTFTNFVDRLKTTAVPEQIDNSLLMSMSGGLRGSLRSALRFLGLTDANDTVNTTFHDLVQSHGTESWPQVLSGVIDTAYAPILNGLDLTRVTPQQLNGKFKAIDMTGQMAEKAIRFLLSAMESANRPFSPHLAVRMPSAPRAGKKQTKVGKPTAGQDRDSDAGGAGHPDEIHIPTTGVKTRAFSFPIPGEPDIRVVVPENLEDVDVWAMVDATVRTYIRLNGKVRARHETKPKEDDA